MQIIHIDIPELPALGLKAIKMERLGKVVVLAGKNGAGKTRLLGRLNAWTNEKLASPAISRDEFCRQFWSRNEKEFGHLARTAWWRDDAAWEKNLLDSNYEPNIRVKFDAKGGKDDQDSIRQTQIVHRNWKFERISSQIFTVKYADCKTLACTYFTIEEIPPVIPGLRAKA